MKCENKDCGKEVYVFYVGDKAEFLCKECYDAGRTRDD
jgi:hypothetical protein